MCWLRISVIDEDSLFSVREIRFEPGYGSARDSKSVLESCKENSMVNRIKGS